MKSNLPNHALIGTLLSSCLLLAIPLASCAQLDKTKDVLLAPGPTARTDSGTHATGTAPAQPLATRGEANLGSEGKPAPSDSPVLPEVAAFGGTLGELGLHLLHSLETPQTDNRVLSPYGVATVLGMVQAGASDDTAREIACLFEPATGSGRKLAERMKTASTALAVPQPGMELITAQRVWLDTSLAHRFNPAYEKLISDTYQADGAVLKFANAAGASHQINAWADKSTRGKIPALLGPDTIKPDTHLVLTSAVYLKARWAEAFSPSATQSLPFMMANGHKINVPTMVGTKRLRTGEIRGMRVVELPYTNSDFAFYIVQPVIPSHPLIALEQDLFGLNMAAWPQLLKPLTADLYLPRFRIAPQPLSLKAALKAAGVLSAFSSEARLEGMAGHAGLVLDDVIHSAGIIVDEAGSEATAATAVTAQTKSLPLAPSEIHIDRPFLFVVMHQPTTMPLFIGRVQQPDN